MAITGERVSTHFPGLFSEVRERTRRIFEIVHPDAYYSRPIPLRHPIAFYDGHLDAFNWVMLFVKTLGAEPFNAAFDTLFERGIDPSDAQAAQQGSATTWPSPQQIADYKGESWARLQQFLSSADRAAHPSPLVRSGNLLYMLLEHELMHQETLLYILHQLPYDRKRRPAGLADPDMGAAPAPRMVDVPAGLAVLGARAGEIAFGWDNEFPRHEVQLPAFSMDAYNVTNGQFLEFMAAGGYQRQELWTDETWAWRDRQGLEHPHFWQQQGGEWLLRGMFAELPLPLSWPVCVTQAEASAYARFAGKALPTEAEWHRAAFGEHQDQPYPWGQAAPGAQHGNFNFSLWSATRVGAYPESASPLGIHDLVGNGWEWTTTPFAPFPGFAPHPVYTGYSADFFDGKHYVLKGGSCFTDARLVRCSFRNWFYWHYPYMDASFRCVIRH